MDPLKSSQSERDGWQVFRNRPAKVAWSCAVCKMANFFSYTADVRNLAQATVLTCVSAHGLVNYFSNQFVRNRFPKHLGVADWDLVMMYRLVREGMPVKQIF